MKTEETEESQREGRGHSRKWEEIKQRIDMHTSIAINIDSRVVKALRWGGIQLEEDKGGIKRVDIYNTLNKKD